MKRIINYFLIAAASVLALASCHNDADVSGEGFPTDVTLSVSIPGGITKSADNPGDGALVNRCILEIYQDGVLYGERLYADVNDLSASFAARLVTGSSYQFVFWADYAEGNAAEGFEDVYYNTADLSNVSIITDAFVNNEDRRDAFYSTSSATIDGTSLNFNLKRPFGQLNLYTVDLAEVPASVDLSTVVAKVSFTEAPAGFNVIEGTLTEDPRISLTPAEFTVPVNFPTTAGEEPAAEAQISFDYLFASSEADQTLVGFTLELESNGVAVCPDFTTDNIPVQQNYRTNVSSNFLTDAVSITVNIEPAFDDPDINIGGEEADELQEVTIAEFKENAAVGDGIWYQLTGEVFDIYNTEYGNFWIKDETGEELRVYGLTKTKQESNDKSFTEIGLKAGDIVTIASLRAEYNDEAQAGGTPPAYYISHVEGETPEVTGDPAAVIISEYVEGTSNNKYLEIANISENEVDLAAYTLIRYTDGDEARATEYQLSGTLASGAVKVYANNQAKLTLPENVVAETSTSVVFTFNGNDPIALTCNGERVDLLGVLGSNEMWGENLTLRRKASVTAPSVTYNVDEWDILDVDDVSNLGALTPAEAEPVEPVEITITSVSGTYYGVANSTNYNYNVTFSGDNGAEFVLDIYGAEWIGGINLNIPAGTYQLSNTKDESNTFYSENSSFSYPAASIDAAPITSGTLVVVNNSWNDNVTIEIEVNGVVYRGYAEKLKIDLEDESALPEPPLGFDSDVEYAAAAQQLDRNFSDIRYTLNKFTLQLDSDTDAPYYQARIEFFANVGRNYQIEPGTYTISADAGDAFTIVQGKFEEDIWMGYVERSGSYATYTAENWSSTTYSAFTSGTMTVAEDGSLSVDFKTAEGYSFKTTCAALDYSNLSLLAPGTSLTSDLTAVVPTGGTATASYHSDFWEIKLTPAGTENLHALDLVVSAAGKTFEQGPAGTYSQASVGGEANTFMPGVAFVKDWGTYFEGTVNGTVYRGYGLNSYGYSVFNGEYATIESGSVTITDNGDGNYLIELSGVDVDGHNVSVTYDGPLTLSDDSGYGNLYLF